MEKNKKIKTLLLVLLVFIICIFSLGIRLEDAEIPEDAGFELHPENNNRHMGSGNTTFVYDDDTVKEFIVKTDDGTFEWVEKRAIDYKEYMEEAIAFWNEESGYEIINMEEKELIPIMAMGTITVDYDRNKRGIAWVSIDDYSGKGNESGEDPDEEYLITKWTLTINTYKFERRNADGTYYYNDEDKVKIIAHEIGHVFGLADLKNKDFQELLMYEKHKKDDVKTITANDIQGMEVVTENFISDEWVPVATEDRCSNHVYTTRSGGNITVEHKDTHLCIDGSDITCNDCGYIKPEQIPIVNIGGLLVARIDGQSWVINRGLLNYFTDLTGYSSCYNLPRGGTLCWNDIGDGNPGHKYVYNYNGIDYYKSIDKRDDPQAFCKLQSMSSVRNSYGGRYTLRRFQWMYYSQCYATNRKSKGIFWAQLKFNEEEGYFIEMKKGLIPEGSFLFSVHSDVWTIASGEFGLSTLHIPVYFSNESDYCSPIMSVDGYIDLSSEILKSVLIDYYNPELVFMLRWPGSDLDLTLIAPDGTIINPDFACQDPNIDYVETDTYEFYRIFKPPAGQWQAKIKAVDIEGEEQYALEVFGKDSYVQESSTELTLEFRSIVQYSDILSGKATLTSEGTPLENMEVEFGCMLPAETLVTNEAGEVYSSLYKVEEPSGKSAKPVCVNFHGINNYLSSYSEQYITIEKEDASIAYNGDNIAEAGAPVTLSCKVPEEPDESPGDITLAGPVTFSLTTEEGFSETFSADVDSNGIATVVTELSTGLYKIIATIDSDYYRAEPSEEALLAVYDAECPQITEGGYFVPEESTAKVDFSFELNYKKDGTLKGNLNLIDHNTESNYKATDFTYLIVVGSKAYFAGNLNINKEGSYPFMAVIEDNGSSGKDSDRFCIDILVDGQHITFDRLIDNGNIVVHK